MEPLLAWHCWRIPEGRRETISSSYSSGHQQHHIYKQLDPGNWISVKSMVQTTLEKLTVAAALHSSCETIYKWERKTCRLTLTVLKSVRKKTTRLCYEPSVLWKAHVIQYMLLEYWIQCFRSSSTTNDALLFLNLIFFLILFLISIYI